MKKRSITVKGTEVTIIARHQQDYISLTDMLRGFGDDMVLYGWLRNKNTVEFLGIWEQLNNPDFKPIEFERLLSQSGLNRFSLSPAKWVAATGAIGVYSKAGKGGSTYAHKDIAFEFGSWLSPEFKLYLITEFQRLKEQEASATALHETSLAWLTAELGKPFEGTTVVVTHHVPTLLHYPPEYVGGALNEAFAVELHDLIADSNITAWIYGHHHRNIAPYTIGRQPSGRQGTQMLTNQLGYVRLGEEGGFDLNQKLVLDRSTLTLNNSQL